MTRQEFQLAIESFIQRYRLTPTTFGLWAMNDSRFLFDLRNGRCCSLATVEKVCTFMASHEAKQEARRKVLIDHE